MARPRMEAEFIRKQRTEALKDQSNCCRYCFAPLTQSTVTADHRVPRSKGGMNNRENIVASCGPCNSIKGSRTVGEFTKLIKNPPTGSPLSLWLSWSRRKIWLSTHRASRNILSSVGLPNNTPVGMKIPVDTNQG